MSAAPVRAPPRSAVAPPLFGALRCGAGTGVRVPIRSVTGDGFFGPAIPAGRRSGNLDLGRGRRDVHHVGGHGSKRPGHRAWSCQDRGFHPRAYQGPGRGRESPVSRCDDDPIEPGADVLRQNVQECQVRAVGAGAHDVADARPTASDGQQADMAEAHHHLVVRLKLQRAVESGFGPLDLALVPAGAADQVLDVNGDEAASAPCNTPVSTVPSVVSKVRI